MKKLNIGHLLILYMAAGFMSCTGSEEKIEKMETGKQAATDTNYNKGAFGYDVQFVQQHQKTIVLKDATGNAQVLICPDYQGRVLTSTASGATGSSFGYLNYSRISSKKETPHIQSYGGEDRFWIGPQGGQYAIFFKKNDPFDLDHWETPAPLDKEAFEVVSQNDTAVRFSKKMQLQNYSGTRFDVGVKRDIALIDKATAAAHLGVAITDVEFVGFESKNELINAGKEPWQKSKGLLSVWILGMFPGDEATTVVIPYKNAGSGEPVVSEYFTDILGKLPANRLKQSGNVVYYKGDGNYCSKIGLGPKHALPLFGSYNAGEGVLTIIQYTLPEGERNYVNSAFELQKEPYSGDVINSYNDGTLDHKPATPTFYELESSSPAKALKPGESIVHVHRTFHFVGDKVRLDALAKAILGVGLQEIDGQF